MKGTIENRDQFLINIANRLGRRVKTNIDPPNWKYRPQEKVLKGATKDELVEVLREQCKEVSTKFILTNKNDLIDTLKEEVNHLGGGPVIATADPRFEQFGILHLLTDEWPKEGIDVSIWDELIGRVNIENANVANVSISISDITLAESGTVVLQSGKGKGRSIHFLPQASIFVIPKSTIVPRTTQAAKILREKLKKGEHIPSCINFITGPSNSADIEMVPIWGVHGPVKATYIVIEDL